MSAPTMKFMALAVLSMVVLHSFSAHSANAQQFSRRVRGHIRVVQTEAGLTLTWDEMVHTTEYNIDAYNEDAPADEYLDLHNFWTGSTENSIRTHFIPAWFYEGWTLMKINVSSQDDNISEVRSIWEIFWYVAGGGHGDGVGYYQESFLLGAIGKAYRVSDDQIDLYEIIEGTTQGVLALRITQEEIDEALEAAGEATCVKASRNDRASVTVWADGNVTFSIGPDYETKIFHVLLEGGLGGPRSSAIRRPTARRRGPTVRIEEISEI